MKWMNISRRKMLGLLIACGVYTPFSGLQASTLQPHSSTGNFRFIYENATYKAEFLDFLTNVFNLYPESEMHNLIASVTKKFGSDEDIYKNLQSDTPDIKPLLSDLTYALPALAKQKKEMAEQTSSLLDTSRRYEGYLEFGSTGRYLDALEECIDIEGDRHFVSERDATYAIPDMIDRGQIFKAGTFSPLNNYQFDLNRNIPENSLDLVTVYIGFHHCPIDLRESFFGAIRDRMTKNGRLIVRDHDVNNEKMWKMVSLAHDVFNMGTNETWAYNNNEFRAFYSLAELDTLLVKAGFKSNGKKLFQKGDPTRNALMVYQKA